MKPTVLIVDDDEAIQFGFSRYLKKRDYAVVTASCLSEARDALAAQRPEVVLLDLNLPDGNGIDWIDEVRPAHPALGIIVITAVDEIQVAVDAMRRGADNFLTKPVNMADLDVHLEKMIELRALRRGEMARERLASPDEPFFGGSEPAKRALDLANTAAENDSPILLQGETGTGKGVMAKWIHEHSRRKDAEFVEVNCSSLRGELLASELFGHAKGAFTSAVRDRPGLIEIADRGTLFLDEIGDMDVGVQAQFLKVVEEKRYRRLGEAQMRQSDFRVICATNHDLGEAATKGDFRQDLYYRINLFPVHLPALREAREDVPALVRHVFDALGASDTKIPAGIMTAFKDYRWPGNIRELRNVVERSLLLARGAPLAMAHFPGLTPSVAPAEPAAGTWNLEEVEDAHIHRAYEHFGGNAARAAKALGVSVRTLYRKLKQEQEEEEAG